MSLLTPPPSLRIVFVLEEPGRIEICADTREDELRLRAWLRRSRAMAALPEIAVRLLDDLDEIDREAAA